MTAPPLVTISLVTWNGRRWLPALLASIRAQTLQAWELVILDNASADGSGAWLREQAAGDPRIQVTCSSVNLGYAAAHNRIILAVTADTVVLLNQDVVLDRAFLEVAADRLRAMPSLGSIQAHVGRLGEDGTPRETIDTTGLMMRRDRRSVSRDQMLRSTEVDRGPGPVWGVDGPAPVYRRSALLSAALPRRGGGREVLDEDFVAQKVDVDLAWRLQRLGWDCRYEPAAMAWHARSGGDTADGSIWTMVRANMANPPPERAMAWSNQRLTLLKNDEPRAVWRDLPQIARHELATWIWMLLADQRRLPAVARLYRLAPAAMRKRRALLRSIAARRSAT